MPAGKPPNNFAFDGEAKDKVSQILALDVPVVAVSYVAFRTGLCFIRMLSIMCKFDVNF